MVVVRRAKKPKQLLVRRRGRTRMSQYARNIDQLELKAARWWPKALATQEGETSIIPLLLKTQDEFLSILTLAKDRPDQVFDLIKAANFPANLFLKHLVVLADFGGEKIQRLNACFAATFPKKNGHLVLEYIWNEQTFMYQFAALPTKGTLNNHKLHIDGSSLNETHVTNDLLRDMIMILLFGANCTSDTVADVLKKCEIGNLLGKSKELQLYVKQKYIHVSRITGGAEANTLGQIAQHYIAKFLKDALGSSYTVTPNGHIPGITQNDGRTLTSFDAVVKKDKRYVAVEVSFQVTTNSTIERKAGQAGERYRSLSAAGHHIAYVIDGAGNFQRRSAVSTICQNSHCTVAYTDDELKLLASFIKEVMK